MKASTLNRPPSKHYGAEFMIAHDGQCAAGLYHSPHNPDGFQLSGSAIDEIPDEDGRAIAMSSHAAFLIPDQPEKGGQSIRVSVNITDDVVIDALNLLWRADLGGRRRLPGSGLFSFTP